MKKLDILSNDAMKNAVRSSTKCCLMVSEEDDEADTTAPEDIPTSRWTRIGSLTIDSRWTLMQRRIAMKMTSPSRSS